MNTSTIGRHHHPILGPIHFEFQHVFRSLGNERLIIGGVAVICVLTLGAGILLLAPLLWMRHRARSTRTYICEGGIAQFRGANEVKLVRWEDIEAIYEIWRSGSDPQLRFPQIVCKNRAKLSFADTDNATEYKLRSALYDLYLMPLLRDYEARIQQGETVYFGPFNVSREHLGHRQRQVPWHEIFEVMEVNSFMNGTLEGVAFSCRFGGTDGFHEDIRLIPNYGVFYRIVYAFTG